MQTTRPFRATVGALLTLGLFASTLAQPATAALIGAGTLLSGSMTATAPGHATPAREHIRERLRDLGAGTAGLEERVAGLTDDEARQLAERLDRLPAGGDALELLVLVFLVLLFTDILGLTDVYTFVKKPAHR